MGIAIRQIPQSTIILGLDGRYDSKIKWLPVLIFRRKQCSGSKKSGDGWFFGRVEILAISLWKGFPNFEMLDAKIASALNKMIQNSQFKKQVSLKEQKAQKEDRFPRGRQIASMIYDYFRVTGAHDTVLDYADLFSVTLRDDHVQEFDTRWDEVLWSMSKIPSYVQQEGGVADSSGADSDAMEAREDLWSMSGKFFCRHHVTPGDQLYVAKESSFSTLVKFIDVVGQAKSCKDLWNTDGILILSESWSGSTRSASSTNVYKETQVTSRPETIWTEAWLSMSKCVRKKVKQQCEIEKQTYKKLNVTRETSTIFQPTK